MTDSLLACTYIPTYVHTYFTCRKCCRQLGLGLGLGRTDCVERGKEKMTLVGILFPRRIREDSEEGRASGAGQEMRRGGGGSSGGF